ncbi:MAG: GTP-binding protein, partial [Candidatus Heimdallarchaeota archaeon]|nr:GTP-binding protein [Candidatus Heimdallarchaeota archaeon]
YSEPMKIRMSCWDTGGQEMFTYLRPKYYTGATCAIIVYDITNQSSFDDLDVWVNEVLSKCPDIPVIISGNKFDLNEARSIDKDTILDYIRLKKFDYVETSALSGFNVDKLFHHASRLSHQYGEEMLKFRKEYIL